MSPMRFVRPRLGPWWILSGGLLVGLVIVLSGHVRLGGIALAASLVGAGVLRLVLPQARLGGLAVRSRSADVVALVGIGLALAAVVFSLDLRPR